MHHPDMGLKGPPSLIYLIKSTINRGRVAKPELLLVYTYTVTLTLTLTLTNR